MENARILVVEDEGIVALSIRRTLERMGYSVPAVASSGEEAIQISAEIHPDLALMDIRLSGEMDGIEAAQQMRARFDIPVVYLTAYADEATLRRAEATQPFGYLLKPFDERELHSTIAMAVYKHGMERRLRESEEKYRLLVENANEAIVVAQDGMLKFLNPKGSEIAGYTSEELASMPFVELIHPDDRQAAVEYYMRCLSGEETPQIYALRLIGKDGNIKWLESNAVLITWEGRPATLNFLSDITERVRADEEAQRRTENLMAIGELAIQCAASSPETDLFELIAEKLRSITDALATSISTYDPETKELIVRYLAVRGPILSELNALLGRNIIGMRIPVSPEMLKRMLAEVVTVVEDLSETTFGAVPKPIAAAIQKTFSIGSFTGLALSYGGELVGTAVIVMTKERAPLSLDMARTLAYVAAVSLRRKRAEDELRESEERFRNVFENSPIGMYRTTPAGQIVMTNPALVHMLGYASSEELAQRNLESEGYVPDHPRSDFRQRIEREGQIVGLEAAWVRKDGSLLWVRENARAIYDQHGNALYYEGTVEDITERKWAEKEIQQRSQQLWVLNEISQAVTSTLDLQETLVLITDHTVRLLDVAAASVALCDEAREDLWFAAASGAGSDYVLGKRLALGRGIAGWAAQHGQPVLVPDVLQDARFFDEFDRESGFVTHSILCVPLQTKGRTIGVIEVMNKGGGSFDQEDLRLLTALAAPAATAIEHARLFDAEVRRRYEAETLREATAALASTLNLNQVLDSILTHLAQVVPYDSACLFLQEDARLHAVAERGFPVSNQLAGRDYPNEDALFREIQRTSQPLILADAQADPRFQNWGGTDYVRGWMGVPLVVRGEIIGCLTMDSRQVAAYRKQEAALAQAFATQAAAAIQNARLFEQVRSGRERLQTLSHRLVEVQESERRHIARELHDEIGQSLTGLLLTLDMTRRLPADEVLGNLDEAQGMVNGLIAQVRELSLDLRPAMLDDLGLLPAMLWHVERYTTQTGIHVNFKHIGLEGQRFPPQIETAAYRMMQEGLTNVARHADVSEVIVRVWTNPDALNVQIEDQGAGFDPRLALAAGLSSGLSGMRERAVLLGGHLRIESAPGAGTRLTAELPLSPAK